MNILMTGFMSFMGALTGGFIISLVAIKIMDERYVKKGDIYEK